MSKLLGVLASLVVFGSFVIGAPSVSAAGLRVEAEPAPLRVIVTIPPLKGLVEPLLPKGSTVKVLMPPGRSEHNYEFTPADLAEVGRADVMVYVGLGLEPQVERFLSDHKSATRVDVCFADAAGVDADGECVHQDEGHKHADDEKSAHKHEDDHDDHSHDHDGHNHGPVDPHVWLDPVLVKKAVPGLGAAVEKAMKQRGLATAEAKETLAKAGEALAAQIGEIDEAYRTKLGPLKGSKIVTHHAAFGRLAERYGLVIAEVIRAIENGEPTPGRIAAIVKAIQAEQVRVIFVEPQFNAAAAERIALAANVRVGVLDPLGDGDWFAMMRGNLEALVVGLK